MSFGAAVEHLHSLCMELAPLPSGAAPRRKFELEHMRILARALGDPQRQFPAILIAGTNGKGSTAATLASIMKTAGYRTGLYTSPHLSSVTERIRTAEPHASFADIPEADFARLYFRVDDAATRLVAAGDLPHHPSFFEVLTALAFLFFAERKLDIAILEVGLGGRLDATNIVEPLLSVITDIALDHQEYLGDTISAIAREKAGILRQNGILVTLPQHPEANQAIGEVAVALNVRGINAADYLPDRQTSAPLPAAPLETRHSDPLLGQNLGRSLADDILPSRDPAPEIGRNSSPGTMLLSSTRSLEDAERLAPEIGPDFSPGTTLISSRRPLEDAERLAPEIGRDFSPGTNATGLARALAPETRLPAHLDPSNAFMKSVANSYIITLDGEPLLIGSPLAGEHQRRNIALAIAAAIEIRNRNNYKVDATTLDRNHNCYNITNTAIQQGITNTVWPGRLEFLTPDLVLDVAHNPAGAWTVRAMIANLPEIRPRTLIFSCLRDKDLKEMAQILFPLFDSTGGRPHDHIVLTQIDNPRAAPLADLEAVARHLDIPFHSAADPGEALALARSLTPTGGPVMATGSVYLIGTLREIALAQNQAVHPQ